MTDTRIATWTAPEPCGLGLVTYLEQNGVALGSVYWCGGTHLANTQTRRFPPATSLHLAKMMVENTALADLVSYRTEGTA